MILTLGIGITALGIGAVVQSKTYVETLVSTAVIAIGAILVESGVSAL